ncbi:hypothetical protein GOP47_0005911 [Adiantum capillus-veneris]|uniref:Peptide chain release factor domain-containing protein n=1 Tax=Adiantum capillus-veneris TaxID=13818 RepID=A0A9D4V1V1_ADICA|nr:hypothetical protein GOP47_0005911 [Adiantum capillus-veneris]
MRTRVLRRSLWRLAQAPTTSVPSWLAAPFGNVSSAKSRLEPWAPQTPWTHRLLYCTSCLSEDPSTWEGANETDNIAARGWQINEDSESDWRSHAASAARSLQLIKCRMRWKEMLVRVKQLDKILENPDLWQDPNSAAKHSRERGAVASRLKSFRQLEVDLAEHVGLAELAHEENDHQVEAEATKALAKLRQIAKERETAALLNGDQDACSCFLEVQAGAGGTESMDWAAMVLRMYRLWASNRGFETTTVDEVQGEDAGIKRATLRLDGDYAYGYAKCEAGVHRLVRISPFDSNKRRHTSFAAVAVIPILDTGSQFNINESDLRIDTFCSGGPGGQHANKTESAVRIVHLPTGITAQCQSERSQHRNKQTAMAVLQARLQQREMALQAKANAHHTASLGEISWGNQIRSYVLQPYRMVKDLRTHYEVSDPDAVLDGDLDGFIFSLLAKSTSES